MSDEFVPYLKGDLDARQHRIYNLPDPVDSNEVATKAYVDAGGGSQAGAVRVLKYDFDFTQADDLAVGVPVWTPAIGDELDDAWFEGEAWTDDGEVSPEPDLGWITAGAFDPAGLFADLAGFSPITLGDLSGFQGSPKFANLTTNGTRFSLFFNWFGGYIGSGGNPQSLPTVRALTTDPLMLVVSGDATPSGDPFDGSAGSATLYLKVATPVATP